jgi:hypothetical protein
VVKKVSRWVKREKVEKKERVIIGSVTFGIATGKLYESIVDFLRVICHSGFCVNYPRRFELRSTWTAAIITIIVFVFVFFWEINTGREIISGYFLEILID